MSTPRRWPRKCVNKRKDVKYQTIVSHRWVFDSGQGPIGRDEIFPVPTCLSALYLTTVARSDGNGGR